MVRSHDERDLVAATRAARAMLQALGIQVDSDELVDTPARMVDALAEILSPPPFDVTTFHNDGYEQLVVQRGIPFRSLCEHHILPFRGTADVGYLPDQELIGLSKLARMVEFFAGQVQTQERMTSQIATWLAEATGAKGVGVVVRAEHECMSLRGARVSGVQTSTSALLGLLREDGRARNEFFALTKQ